VRLRVPNGRVPPIESISPKGGQAGAQGHPPRGTLTPRTPSGETYQGVARRTGAPAP